MMYEITRTVYATEDGTVTHESGEGKNRVVFVKGNSVTQEEAAALRLPELDAASEAKEAEEAKNLDPLAGLKPAAHAETKIKGESKPAKKTAHTPPQETK